MIFTMLSCWLNFLRQYQYDHRIIYQYHIIYRYLVEYYLTLTFYVIWGLTNMLSCAVRKVRIQIMYILILTINLKL